MRTNGGPARVVHRWGKPPDAESQGADATGWLGYGANGMAVYYLRRDPHSGTITLHEADENNHARPAVIATYDSVRDAHRSLLAVGVQWRDLIGEA